MVGDGTSCVSVTDRRRRTGRRAPRPPRRIVGAARRSIASVGSAARRGKSVEIVPLQPRTTSASHAARRNAAAIRTQPARRRLPVTPAPATSTSTSVDVSGTGTQPLRSPRRRDDDPARAGASTSHAPAQAPGRHDDARNVDDAGTCARTDDSGCDAGAVTSCRSARSRSKRMRRVLQTRLTKLGRTAHIDHADTLYLRPHRTVRHARGDSGEPGARGIARS